MLLVTSIVKRYFQVGVVGSLRRVECSRCVELIVLPIIIIAILPLVLSSTVVYCVRTSFLELYMALVIYAVAATSGIVFNKLASDRHVHVMRAMGGGLVEQP